MADSTSEVIKRDDDRPGYGVARSDAMGGEVTTTAEAATSQLEAQARAMVQARFYIAKQPHMQRSWDQVEQKLRKECARPGFANSAWWVLPLGRDPKKYPKGLSIRFAEAALRLSGNIDVQTQTVFDDDWKRIVRVTVLDLETNFAYSNELTIEKTVERREPGDRRVISFRQNSEESMTYLVAATEQELALKQGSAVSKAIRTLGLRLIPGDILDECRALIEDTRAKGAQAEDPEAARKSILDNFADLGILPADLAKYLEHDTNVFQPAERELLRGVYSAIKNGMGTWKDVMEAKFGQTSEGEESPAAKRIKDAISKRRTAAPTAAPVAGTGAAATPAGKTETHAKADATAPTQPASSTNPAPAGQTPTATAGPGDQTAAPTGTSLAPAFASWEAFDAEVEKKWNEERVTFKPARIIVAGKSCVLSADGEGYAEETAAPAAKQDPPAGRTPLNLRRRT